MFFKRLFQAARVFFSLLLMRGIIVEGKKIHLSGPVKMRIFFEKMGGAFARFGQILALRQDFLPYQYSNELLMLSNEAMPVPYVQIREVFVKEKNISPEDFFSEFESKPISSSSLAQVYRARLKDGNEVAVKIQRPDVKKLFEEDFKVLIFLSMLADFFALFSGIRVREMVSEFIFWSKREMDFTFESRNAFIIRKHSEEYPMTIIPEQYFELSSTKVVIQEFIRGGISISDFLKEKREDVNAQELSYYLVFDLMRQYFIEGFFHACPHPSNLIFLPEIPPSGGLAYIDFSITEKAGPKRIPYLKILYGIAKKNPDYIAENLFEFGKELMAGDAAKYFSRAGKEKESFEKISGKIKELLINDLKEDALKILKKNSSQIFSGLKKISEKYNIYLPKEIVLHLRALSAINAIALDISSDFDFIKALSRFFERYSPEKAEEIITGGKHKEIQEDIASAGEQADWKAFRKIAALEKEKRAADKKRFIKMALRYSKKYGELKLMIKNLKLKT